MKGVVCVGVLCFTEGMDEEKDEYFTKLRARLDVDFRLLRAAIAAVEPAAVVPSCPDWTADQLAHHVGQTYLHKVECIRQGRFPENWPPEGLNPNAVEFLDEAHAALVQCFDEHQPPDFAATWQSTDQTVGFWIRRMCHETLVHRVDGELVAGLELAPIPAEVALDGVDEFLSLFIGYLSTDWPEHFGPALAEADERPVTVIARDRAWTLTARPEAVEVLSGTAPNDNPLLEKPAATITAEPGNLLLWLWGRLEDRAVHREGDEQLLAQFRAVRDLGTQG